MTLALMTTAHYGRAIGTPKNEPEHRVQSGEPAGLQSRAEEQVVPLRAGVSAKGEGGR